MKLMEDVQVKIHENNKNKIEPQSNREEEKEEFIRVEDGNDDEEEERLSMISKNRLDITLFFHNFILCAISVSL